jgi:heme/copper-type cytochrome/quinol oxidase subunit 2
MDDELTPEELEQRQRRRLVRSMIVIAVVVAMVAMLLFPVIVRFVQTPREPDTVIAMRAEVPCRTMDS